MPTLKFGAHMPTAGGLHRALLEGKAIGCETVQIFTASPRTWSHPPLNADTIATWKHCVQQTGLGPLFAHDSYLINLASPDPELRAKSVDAFQGELERCEALGLSCLVSHPGAHVGQGVEAGLETLVTSLNDVLARTAGFQVRVALETTAAKGTTLGGEFGHFGTVLARIATPERLAFCVDTCHLFDAGIDLVKDPSGVWDAFDREVGMDRLVCIHANDSKFGLGSKRDQHEHIGHGAIGDAGFRAFLRDPRLPEGLPVIVETPEAETHHETNVRRLRALVAQTPADA